MDAQEVLTRIDTLLRQVAVETLAVVNQSVNKWSKVVVSVKWVGDSGIFDVVVESTSGGGSKHHTHEMSTYNHLMALWAASRHLEKPWNELLLTIGADGSCNTKFAYEDGNNE